VTVRQAGQDLDTPRPPRAARVAVQAWGLAARAVGVPMRAATKLTLAAAHLIAGAIIIPVVARRLSRPR
jgi:hypothetical protein